MRVLIASDIHGRINAVHRLDEIIQSYQPDGIILLGDYLYNGPRNGVPNDYDPMAVCEVLNKYADKISGIRGNCDSRIDDELLKFPLKDCRVLYINGYRCNLVHGDEYSRDLLKPAKGEFLMYGHTHLYQLENKDGIFYLNPGSVSFPKGGNPPTYATFEPHEVAIHRFDDDKVISLLPLV
jgi:uncharacterized protein